MGHHTRRVLVVVAVVAWYAAALSAGPALDAGHPQEAASQNDPSKGSKDIDRVVAYPMKAVLEAATLAVQVYGCTVKKTTATGLECTRDRHVGVMVGSGGEKVTVQLTEKGTDTRVVVKTGKGFVGRLGKKNWSTPVFDEMMKTLGGGAAK